MDKICFCRNFSFTGKIGEVADLLASEAHPSTILPFFQQIGAWQSQVVRTFILSTRFPRLRCLTPVEGYRSLSLKDLRIVFIGLTLLHHHSLSTIRPSLFYPYVAKVLKISGADFPSLTSTSLIGKKIMPLVADESSTLGNKVRFATTQAIFEYSAPLNKKSKRVINPKILQMTPRGVKNYCRGLKAQKDFNTLTRQVVFLFRKLKEALDTSEGEALLQAKATREYLKANLPRVLSWIDPSALEDIKYYCWKNSGSVDTKGEDTGREILERTLLRPQTLEIMENVSWKWRLSFRRREDNGRDFMIRLVTMLKYSDKIDFTRFTNVDTYSGWKLCLLLQLMDLSKYDSSIDLKDQKAALKDIFDTALRDPDKDPFFELLYMYIHEIYVYYQLESVSEVFTDETAWLHFERCCRDNVMNITIRDPVQTKLILKYQKRARKEAAKASGKDG